MRKKLFVTIDPLGHTIKLFEDTLNKHIAIRHPNIKSHHETIRLAIEQPIIIGHSKKSKDTPTLSW